MGTAAACAFNIVGWPLELMIMRGYPDPPRWPVFFTMAVSAAILGATLLLRRMPRVVAALYVLNVACISAAIYVLNPTFVAVDAHWVPFQMNKLAA